MKTDAVRAVASVPFFTKNSKRNETTAMKKTKQKWAISLVLCITTFSSLVSCKSSQKEKSVIARNTDPGRCRVVDIGEAADFIQKANIVDDRLVIAQGLANPQALVWRDADTSKTFYLTRIMGTERRMFFMRQVGDDEKPGVASIFKGHLIKWSALDPKRSAPMLGALEQQYNIKVTPDNSYLIIQGEKPRGCP